jgi:hypothetical protein
MTKSPKSAMVESVKYQVDGSLAHRLKIVSTARKVD